MTRNNLDAKNRNKIRNSVPNQYQFAIKQVHSFGKVTVKFEHYAIKFIRDTKKLKRKLTRNAETQKIGTPQNWRSSENRQFTNFGDVFNGYI